MIFTARQNTLTAYGTIWDGNGMEFVSLFNQMESQYDSIIIKLHTYGGSVFDGNLIKNAIENSKKTIELHIVGIAASMGAIISQSRNIKTYMVENGFMMIHAPSGYTQGTALDHRNTAKLLDSIEANFIKNLSAKISKPENYVKKWLTGDNWFDANEALKEGLITGIIEPETETIQNELNPTELGVQGMYYQFAALLNENSNTNQNMKKPIIEALGLQNVNEQSSDTAVIEAVRKHYEAKENQYKTELEDEKKKRQNLEAAIAEQNKAAITVEIEAAKKAGKITADQVTTYEGIANASGIETLKTVLAAIPARQPIANMFPAGGGKNTAPVGREDWDWDKWQKEDPRGFEALAKDEPETFQALYNQKFRK